MSRQDRLREYSRPSRPENWRGAGRDMENINRWSDRAAENSITPKNVDKFRAKGGAMDLPPTGETKVKPTTGRSGDQREQAKADKNFVGAADFYPKVRRGA
jgi:hypothetical protein